MIEQAAQWIAPIATMMTAANLGARVTGWGFVVFSIGAVAWVIVALTSGQQNLLISNGFLLIVDLIGIWRWLGRQARYDEGSRTAERRSAAARVPTLFAGGALVGAPLTGTGGEKIGQVVEAMHRCDGASLAYLVVSEGGVVGVGERLHALPPDGLRFGADGVACDLSGEALASLPVLAERAWPAAV